MAMKFSHVYPRALTLTFKRINRFMPQYGNLSKQCVEQTDHPDLLFNEHLRDAI